MTERLYYTDSYLREFRARVVDVVNSGRGVVLDRTAMYPASGGQPHDTGTLAGTEVVDVTEDEESGRVVHLLADAATIDGEVAVAIDWTRRFDHMQQHTGQHLLTAVLADVFGAETVGFHMGADVSTIDLAAVALSAQQLETAERRCNEIVCENRPVAIAFQDATDLSGIRKRSDREGTLRIVSIEGLDRSACGGTHVRSTGEIGAILLRGTEKVRGNMRLEFVCGLRAVRRARADFNGLTAAARVFSSPLDEAPRLAAAAVERLAIAEKRAARLAVEAAELRGAALRATAEVHLRKAHVIDDELRAEARAFCAAGAGTFVAWVADPPSVMLASSQIQAGNTLKPLLAEHGGRGGGSAQIAQGSVASADAAEQIAVALARKSADSSA